MTGHRVTTKEELLTDIEQAWNVLNASLDRLNEALYLSGDYDAINAIIHQRERARPLGEVLADLGHTHQRLLDGLRPLSDADLHKPYRSFLMAETAVGDGRLLINLIYGNTAHHFRQRRVSYRRSEHESESVNLSVQSDGRISRLACSVLGCFGCSRQFGH
jgi:hypothetical protein